MNRKKSPLQFAAHNIQWIIVALMFLAALLVTSKYTQEIFIQLFLWAGLGCSWNLNCGYCKRMSIGHGAFFGIGAYATALLYTRLGVSPWIGMLAGMVICGVVALFLGRLTLKLRGTFFTLTTIAFAEVIRILSTSMKGFTGGSQGIVISFNPGFLNMSWVSKTPYIILCFVYMLVMLLLCLRLEHSKFGYQLIAIGEDTEAAEMLGVNSSVVMTRSYVESAVATAVGGALYTMYYLYIEPDAVFNLNDISLKFVLIVLIGGMGMAFGPLLGASLLIPLNNILRAQFSSISGLYGFLYGLIMLLVVMFQPNGLLAMFSGIYHKLLDRLHSKDSSREEADQSC